MGTPDYCHPGAPPGLARMNASQIHRTRLPARPTRCARSFHPSHAREDILTHIVDYSARTPTNTNVDYYDLETYYREKVIQGPGAFVEIANDYDDFARAFLRKLLRELTPLVSQENSAPRALIQETHARQLSVRSGSTSAYKRPLILRPHLEVKRKERVEKRTLPLEGRLSG